MKQICKKDGIFLTQENPVFKLQKNKALEGRAY